MPPFDTDSPFGMDQQMDYFYLVFFSFFGGGGYVLNLFKINLRNHFKRIFYSRVPMSKNSCLGGWKRSHDRRH